MIDSFGPEEYIVREGLLVMCFCANAVTYEVDFDLRQMNIERFV